MITNTIKSLMLSALIVSAGTSTASDNFSLMTVGKSYVLRLIDVKEDIEYLLKDAEGHILHTEWIRKTDTYQKQFNLKELPIGTYQVVLNSPYKSETYTINALQNKIEILDKDRIVRFKPLLMQEGKKVAVHMIAMNNESLHVQLTDVNGNILYSEMMSGETSLGKQLDLSNLITGTYTINMSAHNKLHTETIEIK